MEVKVEVVVRKPSSERLTRIATLGALGVTVLFSWGLFLGRFLTF